MVVRTVGELRAALALLPDDMPLYADAEAGHVKSLEWDVSAEPCGDGVERFGFSLDG